MKKWTFERFILLYVSKLLLRSKLDSKDVKWVEICVKLNFKKIGAECFFSSNLICKSGGSGGWSKSTSNVTRKCWNQKKKLFSVLGNIKIFYKVTFFWIKRIIPPNFRTLAANDASGFVANCTYSLKIATCNLTSCSKSLAA